MTDEQKRLIREFVNNKPMFDAVCSVLQEEEIIAHDVKDEDDAAYGRAVRVWVKARELIAARINKLVRLSSDNPQPSTINGAR